MPGPQISLISQIASKTKGKKGKREKKELRALGTNYFPARTGLAGRRSRLGLALRAKAVSSSEVAPALPRACFPQPRRHPISRSNGIHWLQQPRFSPVGRTLRLYRILCACPATFRNVCKGRSLQGQCTPGSKDDGHGRGMIMYCRYLRLSCSSHLLDGLAS